MSKEHPCIVITGGATRIGKAIASALAKEGARVVVHYHTSGSDAHQLVELIRHQGGDAIAVRQDLRELEHLDSLFLAAEDHFGTVDGLINSAAVFNKSPFLQTTISEMEEHLTVNLKAPYLLSQQFALSFARTHSAHEVSGFIINIIDAGVLQPAKGFSSYYMAKGGLQTLTYSLAKELAPAIRVNAVSPGAVLPLAGRDETYFSRRRQALPLRRTGSPEDIVKAVRFLIQSDFITGEIIRVDGGGHLL